MLSFSFFLFRFASVPLSDQALFSSVCASIDGQADHNETAIELTSGAVLASSLYEFGVVGVVKHQHKLLMQLHDLTSGQVFWVRIDREYGSMAHSIITENIMATTRECRLFPP